ncbi:hypothetical protein AQUCO_01600181v1 [Aquilegia coerulea]|uniref:MATH domain-containing protein n=2 Tax=Aquilegia coerulea TaxID=218851 RepID=A0A2G5DQF3_AQUCA|nr:hypothetical protein AQUCO_01600181v1 [Aquilegia coerulea]
MTDEIDHKWAKQVYMKLLLRVRDQSIRKEHPQQEACHCLISEMFGSPKFMELGVLTDPNKGFMVNDTLIIEAEVSVLTSLKRSIVNE